MVLIRHTRFRVETFAAYWLQNIYIHMDSRKNEDITEVADIKNFDNAVMVGRMQRMFLVEKTYHRKE